MSRLAFFGSFWSFIGVCYHSVTAEREVVTEKQNAPSLLILRDTAEKLLEKITGGFASYPVKKKRGQDEAHRSKQKPVANVKRSQLPEGFCNDGVEEHNTQPYPSGVKGKLFCISKLSDGDFTEIFLYDFEKKATETCKIYTFTPMYHKNNLEPRRYTKEEIEKAKAKVFQRLESKQEPRWEVDFDAKEDLDKFTQLMFGKCDIDLDFFNPQISALHMGEIHGVNITIGFFPQQEKSPIHVTFTKISSVGYYGSRKDYVSEKPNLLINVERYGRFWRARTFYDNIPIKHAGSDRGVMLLHRSPYVSQVYRIKSETRSTGSNSMDQLFFYDTFDKGDVMFAMMRYKAKWAILSEREPEESHETAV